MRFLARAAQWGWCVVSVAYSEGQAVADSVGSGFAYVTRDGDVLDLLCLRMYRRDGMMDAVKAANPHLHAAGVVYAAGMRIWFPPVELDVTDDASGTVHASSVRLWG